MIPPAVRNLAFCAICAGGLIASHLPSAVAQAPAAAPGFRKVVPGVIRTIDPERDFKELTSVHDIVELDYEWAKQASFRHDVWALEFAFKPVRYVTVDLPAADGKLQRKLIWYMVYKVKNPGVVYRAKPTVYAEVGDDAGADQLLGDARVDFKKKELVAGEVVADKNGEPVKFLPLFLLYSRDNGKAYLDRVLPSVEQAIRDREDPARKLLNTVQIAGEIPASTEEEDNSVWGVVTWEDVDPQTDFFSIYVQGLSNAYIWQDVPRKGKWYARKTLKLDFWRPGDDIDEKEEEIRFMKARWTYLDAKWSSTPEGKSAAPAPEAE